MNDDPKPFEVRGELSWGGAPWSYGSSGPCSGRLDEVCAQLAAAVPDEVDINSDELKRQVVQGGKLPLDISKPWHLVIIYEASPYGWLMAEFGPPLELEPFRRPRRRVRPRQVEVHAGDAVVRVAPWRRGLARRIAKALGLSDPTYVRMYLERAIGAANESSILTIVLWPPRGASPGGRRVSVIVDCRSRRRRGKQS